ncbi:MAG: family efflux transporter, subunit [Firmicutes bacterium]|nr:family efflux transporter, subunit [Bacillota bacterium]
MKKITFKKPVNRKIIRGVTILALAGLIIVYFVRKNQAAVEEEPFFTAQAVIGRVETSISGKGTLNPANQYEVKSLVKGELLSAPFEEGDTVKEDQLLYQISTSEIENSIKAAELNVDKVKLSYSDYLDKQSELQIKSNKGGYIKKLYVKEKDTLQVGSPIADIYNGETMYLDLQFPSYEVGDSWIGKKASITMEATGENLQGKVTAVSDMEEVIDGGILVKKVTICVKNTGGIKAGDQAEAVISDIACYSTGTFRAETEFTLVAETSGKIDHISVKEGKWTSDGEEILSLSSKDLGLQIESTNLSIREAELNLETQKNQMKQYTITAPIAGQVIKKNKKQGDTIDPQSDAQAGPMAIIYDMTYLSFDMNIDELQISRLKLGQKVSIKTEAFPEDSFEGVIEKISLKGDTNNGVTSYPVTVKVQEYKDLMPGMNVTGKIVVEEADHVLTIPSTALQRDNMVYVQSEGAVSEEGSVVPDGFKTVQVEIGLNDGSSVEIKSGIKEGDTVYVPFDMNASGITANGSSIVVE